MALSPCRELSGTSFQALFSTEIKYIPCTGLIALTPTKAHHPAVRHCTSRLATPNMSSKLEPGYGRGGARSAIGQKLQGLQVKGADFEQRTAGNRRCQSPEVAVRTRHMESTP